jgi:hypothetical protein
MRVPCPIRLSGIAHGCRTADKMVLLWLVNLFAILGPTLVPKGLALIKCVIWETIRANPRSYWGDAA